MKGYLKLLALAASLCCFGSVEAQQLLPYQNPDLTAEERAKDLLGRLTLEQKVSLMQNESAAVPELGIQTYNWWSEALHGSARSGLATVFPQAIGMAASFDPELLEQVFDIASTEQRIKYIMARQNGKGVSRYYGLTVWTPNINIFRDPRWGRGQETYGEDPYLTRIMGHAVVTGLQSKSDQKIYGNAGEVQWRKYDKLHACLKHYGVHSGPESERHFFDAANISQRDLAETYLYAFENIVKTTDVHEVMCAYNAFEGKPCCGSDQLLTQILRNEWGYKGLVVSDCGAINDFYSTRYKNHQTFPDDAAASSANAVLSGTDVECGSAYRALPEAVKRGAIKESDIDVSVLRLLTDRFRLGEMDADSIVSWNHIPVADLATSSSDKVALQMAHESMVLLKNSNDILPLSGKKVALIGANAADSIVLWGNYYGEPRHAVTVLEALTKKLGAENVIYQRGSNLVTNETFESAFDKCKTKEGKTGFNVSYWNNLKQEGTPVVKTSYSSPWQLCTGGNTVFAPGVELRDFSGKFTTTFHADKTEKIMLEGFSCGQGQFIINGDTIVRYRTAHGPRPQHYELNVEAGKTYDIQIDFAYCSGEAQFNFNIGAVGTLDVEKLVADTRDADVYIYVGGISPSLEGEEMKVPYDGFKGGDRTYIELPMVQRQTIKRLHETGKPVILVCMSGSAIGLVPETETCDAILQAWYGGQEGGQAVADVLTGDYNPSGRLPVTFYRNVEQLPDFGNYNMKGHTYRYFEDEDGPLFAFGEGKSYSTFKYGDALLRTRENISTKKIVDSAKTDSTSYFHTKRMAKKKNFTSDVENTTNETIVTYEYSVVTNVTNTSKRDGTEVVQVYLKRVDDIEGPLRALRGFKRVFVKAGETVQVEVPIGDFRTFNPETCKLEFVPGDYVIYYGSSSRLQDLKELDVNLTK